MDPLFSVMLFWTVLSTVMALFGLACIKWGVYTSGKTNSSDYRPTLEM